MTEKAFWNSEMETLSPEELDVLEVEALKQQLIYVYENSSFYRQKFEAAGCLPHEFSRREDLAAYPLTTKEELRQTQEEEGRLGGHQCAPMEQIVRIQGTSGTTGRPLLIGLTANDVAQWNEMFARHAWTGGLRPDDLMLNPANFTLFVGGLSECSGAEHMGITVVPAPLGSTGMEKFMELIQILCPSVLFSTPSATQFLAGVVRTELGMEPSQLGFKKGFLAGEALSEDERQSIEADWGITARNFYGLADVGADIAAECGHSPGLHFCAQGALVAELLDPDTLEIIPMTQGAEGEIVFTTINREATPVIRYRVRDMVRVYTDPCPCGRTGFRFHVIGRSDDMIKVKGVNVFPAAVKGIVTQLVPGSEMRMVLPHKGPAFGDNLVIRVEAPREGSVDENAALAELLARTIQNRLVFSPVIEWVDPGTYPPSQYKVAYFEKTYEDQGE